VTLAATASGYDTFTADFLDLTITTPTVVIQPTGDSTQVTEGSPTGDNYFLSLSTPPTADVAVSLSTNSDVTVDKSQILFTPSNWDVPQQITVRAVNDDHYEGSETGFISHTFSSADSYYDGQSTQNLTVTIIDDDNPPDPIVQSPIVQSSTNNVEEEPSTDKPDDVTITALRLVGNRKGNRLKGGALDDVLIGKSGNDVLIGGEGNDKIKGGNGNDTLKGNTGHDVLLGGKGKDKLIGGSGDDSYKGGKDNDKLIFGQGNDVAVFGKRDGRDLIKRFDLKDDILRFKGARTQNSLDIQEEKKGLLISYKKTDVLLKGIDESDLSTKNFDF